MRHSRLARSAVVSMGLVPGAALGNAGIGFFSPGSMLLVLGIIPVIALEAAVLGWWLRPGVKRAFVLSAGANVVSTLAGGVLGFVLDMVLAGATGSMGSAGREGYLVGLALMFAISWGIENLTVRAMLPESARPRAFTATLVANAVSYAGLAACAFALLPPDSMPARARMTEVINAAGIVKTEAAEHYEAHGRFKALIQEAPTRHTRRVSVEESGRVTAVIAYPAVKELDGKAFVFEPVIRDGKLVEWRCYVPEAPLRYFPAMCRYRTAQEAARP